MRKVIGVSKIGIKPIFLDGVKVKVEDDRVCVSCKEKSIEKCLIGISQMTWCLEGGCFKIVDSPNKAKWGTYRSIINWMVCGLIKPYSYTISLKGLGYKCVIEEQEMVFYLGYSHPIRVKVPEGVEVCQVSKNSITITSNDKDKLGRFETYLCSLRRWNAFVDQGVKSSRRTYVKKSFVKKS